jgi:two-component system chemotaxis sensor kinase CheA
MSAIDPDLLRDFLLESREILTKLDGDFVELEKNPGDQQRLKEIFRGVHTVKGTSGFLDLQHLQRVAHAGESLMSRLRDGALTLDGEMTTALLAMVDAIRAMVSEVECSATDGDEPYHALVEKLLRLAGEEPEAPPAPTLPVPAPVAAAPAPPPAPAPVAAPPPALAAVIQPAANDEAAPTFARGKPALAPSSKPTPLPEAPVARKPNEHESHASVADSTVRVDVHLLDRVMTLVGELVLARNQIIQCSSTGRDATLADASQRLNLLTTELHESVMKTRMQAIGTVWNRFPRIVRDLALTCGKKVEVELSGTETELDRTIIEAIKDPLTHLVRNSVDHGLESPEDRMARGKPATGKLRLDAYHEGGQVNLEVTDDGGGINVDRVRAKALESGLVSADRLARMSEHEIMQLIFAPGFSTAAKVTNISGRGVGMDVVKTNIERIGGTVDLQSERFKGTTIKIKLPLTLAIVPALVVEASGERFALPQVNLIELVRLDAEKRKGIERVHGVAMYRLRGNLLPLVFLGELLGIGNGTGDADVVNIVVLQAGDRQFGVVVDRVRDTEEIVVKPLGKALKHLREFSGATIMGDGRVALILDVLGLAISADMGTSTRHAPGHDDVAAAEKATEEPAETLLAFRVGRDRRLALPLSLVARLEELPARSLERSAGRNVVQYRGRIMPLVDLCSVMGAEPAERADKLQVIVFTEQGRSVGLVVDQILDVITERGTVDHAPDDGCLRGTMVLDGRVTDLLDLQRLIERHEPSFYEPARLARVA